MVTIPLYSLSVSGDLAQSVNLSPKDSGQRGQRWGVRQIFSPMAMPVLGPDPSVLITRRSPDWPHAPAGVGEIHARLSAICASTPVTSLPAMRTVQR
jgi:hypothetical protein